MQCQPLNGYWQVRPVNTLDWFPANVPGSVHTDLLASGQIPDPFEGSNEERVQWVAEKSWEYRRFFYPLPALLSQEKIWLVCPGLDTLAEVRLNGKILGQADNMFRTWQWEVKDQLREGENKLEILFRSPVSYIRARERVKRMGALAMGIRGGQHLRKTPSHFGWDWGPRLACIGIWQEIRLEGRSRGRLGEIRFDQEHTPGVVTLTARVQAELWERADERHTIRLRITGPDRQVWQLDAPARPQAVMTVTMTDPQLWWPNGYGAQPLYTAEVELRSGEDDLIDTRQYALGLRTLELRQAEDAYGRSFTFVVNGVSIFCKGANWIPADSFPARITPRRVEELLRAAVATHQNMLRVWGGGYYESDVFYDLCDRLGILVWQDFQFACATYPLDDPAYLENVCAEVGENVQRLRHHASLALWCGNNEIEWMHDTLGWRKRKPALTAAYQRFFFETLPGLLAAEDPGRPYWPSSPSSGDPFHQPNGEQVGDAHLWEVYHRYRMPGYYRQQNPRFVSEFGFQSLPAAASIAQFAPPAARRLDSAVMRTHQRATGGNQRLIWYLAQRFRLPGSFDGLIYLSQVFQAEAVRAGVEHWRRHPERTSGALYWQLNDCWPVISWASIDYYGRWKALHYAARRFFAPVLLSIEDPARRNQRKLGVWVSNDHGTPWQGRIHWTLETLEGEVIEGGNQPVVSPGQSAACQLKLDFTHQNGKVNWRRVIFVAELWAGTQRQALQVATFVPEKDMPLPDPQLHAEMQLDGELLSVRVESKRLARFVEVSLAEAGAPCAAGHVFSDNYFDLPAGRAHHVTCALPPGWTVEQAQAVLRVRSLAEIGPLHSPAASHWQGDRMLIGGLVEMLWKMLIIPAFKR